MKNLEIHSKNSKNFWSANSKFGSIQRQNRQNNWIRSIRKCFNLIDSEVHLLFEKFEKNHFEICSIRFDSTPNSLEPKYKTQGNMRELKRAMRRFSPKDVSSRDISPHATFLPIRHFSPRRFSPRHFSPFKFY